LSNFIYIRTNLAVWTIYMMKDNPTRHFVAFIIAMIGLVAFVAGYFAAEFGWWWTGFGVLIIYGGVFKALK